MKFLNIRSRRYAVPVQKRLLKPTKQALIKAPPLRSRSNKPLAMDTEDLLNILTYYHLQEFSSGRELINQIRNEAVQQAAEQVVAMQKQKRRCRPKHRKR